MALTSQRHMESGALTTDSVGSQTLTNTGTAALAAGVQNGCITVGTGTGVYLGAVIDSITTWNSYTIGGRYNPNTQPSGREQTLCAFQTSSTNKCNIYLVYGDQRIGGGVIGVSCIRSRANVAGAAINYTITVSTGSRCHIVHRYDGTNMDLFVNGVFRSTTTQSGNGSGSPTNFTYIGSEPSNAAYRAGRGKMDEVYVNSGVFGYGQIKNQYIKYKGYFSS